MDLWTIYDHPTDYPDLYVARRWRIGAGVMIATGHVLGDTDIEKIRQNLYRRGLVRINRSPQDDPKIMEVWL